MRRVFWWVMIAAIVVLPLWVLFGRALFGGPLGAGLVLQALLAPLLALLIGVVALITRARKDVREAGRVAWRDIACIAPWFVVILVLGMTIVDGTGSRQGSALTALLGADALTASSVIAGLATLATLLGGIVLLIVQTRALLLETRSRLQRFADEMQTRSTSGVRPIVEQEAVFERLDGPQAGQTIRIEREHRD